MKPIRWIREKAVNAWYGLGAWMTVTLWGLFDGMAQPGLSLQAEMLDCRHEIVIPCPPSYVFPDHPVYPRKTVVFDDVHLCEARVRDMLSLTPRRERFKAFHLRKPPEFETLPPLPDVFEIPVKKASKRKATATKKRKSIKALTPKRKPKAGAKTVTRKKRA